MKIFNSSQVRDIDAFTIANEPVASVDLMERASKAFVNWYVKNFDVSRRIVVFAGPGNNGGDALAISRLLLERNYRLLVFTVDLTGNFSPDFKTNLTRLNKIFPGVLAELKQGYVLPEIGRDNIVIDGIFGSGLSRPAEGFAGEIICHINKSEARVLAIDIPSGLSGEDNTDNLPENIIRADYTLSFQFPFLSFFFAENRQYTGEWYILDIGLHPDVIAGTPSLYHTNDVDDIKKVLKGRDKFSHKGTFGHALLICGSYGMMGAAVLAAKACLRGGAGLVTVHVPGSGYNIMQSTAPEALVSIDKSKNFFTDFPDPGKFSAIGAGPGIGLEKETCKGLKRLLEEARIPMVFDADAINILANNRDWLNKLPEGTILTPHPGEFDRLAGSSGSMWERFQKQLEIAGRYNINIILKGAHSILVTQEGETWFNTTGNPGMATGGSGDVLTGIISSLLAQGYSPSHASRAGMFIHGLAGDIAVRKKSEEALIASDITDCLGEAFLFLHQ